MCRQRQARRHPIVRCRLGKGTVGVRFQLHRTHVPLLTSEHEKLREGTRWSKVLNERAQTAMTVASAWCCERRVMSNAPPVPIGASSSSVERQPLPLHHQ